MPQANISTLRLEFKAAEMERTRARRDGDWSAAKVATRKMQELSEQISEALGSPNAPYFKKVQEENGHGQIF